MVVVCVQAHLPPKQRSNKVLITQHLLFLLGLLINYSGTIFAYYGSTNHISMTTSKPIYPHIALIFCNIVWACDYPFYNLVLGKYISPLAMVSASLVVAALLSLLPLLWEKAESVEPKDRLKILGLALLMGVMRKLCMMYGLANTSAIDGSIISTTTPLIVLLLSVIAGLDRFTTQRVFGLLIGMAGTIALIISSNSSVHEHSGTMGNILIASSAFVSALYMVWFKQILGKYRISTLLRWIYCSSAFIMLPFGIHDIITTDYAAMHGGIMLATLFVLIVPTYLPNLLLNYSLKSVAPTITSIYSYIQPVIAIMLAVVMGLDKPHLDTLFFALIIFAGVGLVIGSYRNSTTTPHYH